MSQYPEHEDLVGQAHHMAARARNLLAEAVEVADGYERLCWHHAQLDDAPPEDSPQERRFTDPMLEVGTALGVIRLKAGDAQPDLPNPNHVEQTLPEVPEYRRLFDRERDRDRWLFQQGREVGR